MIEGDKNGSPMSTGEQLAQQSASLMSLENRGTDIGQSHKQIVETISMEFDNEAKA